ncbi:ABC transporter permease [Paenibacillus sp. S-38]|uniref:ABC transporter permease n=1 Tax=Paenibacillus sp. S-38 TaxID=3416710 RepID=UPI003CF0B0C2
MTGVLYAEWLKLRRSRGLWLLLFILFVKHVIEFSVYYQDLANSPSRLTWSWTYYTHYRQFALGLMPIITGLLVGYAVIGEFQHNTVTGMLTYPIRRSTFLLGKYAAVFLLTILVYGADFGMKAAGGLLFGLPPVPWTMWLRYIECAMLLILVSFALVPLFACISLAFRSYIANMAAGTLAAVIGEVVWDVTDIAVRFPFTYPGILVGSLLDIPSRSAGSAELLQGGIGLLLLFAVFLAGSLRVLARKDIHAHEG